MTYNTVQLKQVICRIFNFSGFYGLTYDVTCKDKSPEVKIKVKLSLLLTIKSEKIIYAKAELFNVR